MRHPAEGTSSGISAMESGRHAKAINELLEMLDSEETPEVKLKEFLGHTPMQVCCGAVLGFIVALALG